jgi:cysteine synthase
MRALGAGLVLVSYDVAWQTLEARAYAGVEGTFIHPFDDHAFIAGHGTMGLEILEQAPDTAAVVASIGGGGLAVGVGSALKALKPGIKVLVGTNSVLTAADGGFQFGRLPSDFYNVELENGGAGFTPRLFQLSLTSDQTNLVFRTASVSLTLEHDAEAGVDTLTAGGAIPNHDYRLEGSVDMAGWMLLKMVTSDTQGRVRAVYQPGATPVWFYRIVVP